MIKGCQKRMIFVKNTGCDLFDEAYFVLKDDIPANAELDSSIVQIATEIINQSMPLKPKRRRPSRLHRGVLGFFIGCAFSIAVSAFVFFAIL